MKNLLRILSSLLVTSSIVPSIMQTEFLGIKLKEFKNISIQLKVPGIMEETDHYFLVASIQSIFSFFKVDIKEFNQDKIYDDLLQKDPGTGLPDSLILSHLVADYVTVNAIRSGNSSAIYSYNDLGQYFGANVEEARTFQNYVLESLQYNQPLIFNFKTPEMSMGHAIVITGIEANRGNVWETSYTYIDPIDGQTGTFLGSEIQSHTSTGAKIIGYDRLPEAINLRESLIVIQNQEVGEDYLNNANLKKVSSIKTDVTELTGIKKLGDLRDTFGKISLSKFTGEIYRFSNRRPVDGGDFSLSTNAFPDQAKEWTGKQIEVASTMEEIGSAHIDGKIAAQLKFETSESNHLIMTLEIYVAGQAWATPNYGHVWFRTGDILTFIKRER